MSKIIASSADKRVHITDEEWLSLGLGLEDHHAVFYKIMEMGKPVFDETIDTACIQFDANGDYVWFRFNPSFWESLNEYNKSFVISHEALHVVLNHGSRAKDAGINGGAANTAMDIVVNHSLVKNFGFDRTKIQNESQLCWIDTVFKDRDPKPPEDESFEYYLGLFEVVYGMGGMGTGEEGDGSPKTLDDHSGMGKQSDDWGKVLKDLNENLTPEEKKSLQNTVKKHYQDSDKKEGRERSPQGTGHWVFLNTGYVKKKRKWEQVIKNWALKHIRSTEKEVEQWSRTNRRMVALPNDMIIPTEMEMEVNDPEACKIDVWFYLDTSGSCWNLKDRFFTAAESLPEWRFKVRLFCFDTEIQETTLQSKKVYGGGGTSFSILEEHIQSEMNRGERHPMAVFVITDGYGDQIRPAKQDRWHWFLTEYGVVSCLPKGSNVYNLRDYE